MTPASGLRQALAAAQPAAGALLLALLVVAAVGGPHLAAEEPEDAFWIAIEAGDAAYDGDRLDTAVEHYRRALGLAEGGDLGSESLSLAAGNLGAALLALGRPADAEALFARALAIDREVLAADDPELAVSLENTGYALLDLDRGAEAAKLFEEALEVRRRAFPEGWPTDLDEILELAALYVELGDSEAAEPLYQTIIQRLLGDAESARAEGDYQTSLTILDQLVGIIDFAVNGEPAEAVLPPILEMISIHTEIGDLATAEETLGQVEELVSRIGAIEPLNAGWILVAWAELREAQGELVDARDRLRAALGLYESELEAGHPEIAATASRLGSILRDLGRSAEAEEQHRRALEIYRETLEPGDPRIALQLDAVGVALADQGRYREARPLLEESLSWTELHLAADHPLLAQRRFNLGMLLKDMGRLVRAGELVEAGLELQRRLEPEGGRRLSRGLVYSASVLKAAGRFADSEARYREALAIVEGDAAGRTIEERADYATTLGNLALVLAIQGHYAEAERSLAQVLAIERDIRGPDHPLVALAMDNLATVWNDQGRYQQAAELLSDALAIRRGQLGRDHPEISNNLNNLALTLANQGRYREAEELMQRALAIDERIYGAEHGRVASTLGNLATLFERQGRYLEAEPLFRRGLAAAQAAYGEHHPSVGLALANLGFNLFTQKRDEEALELFLEALEAYAATLGLEHPQVATTLENAAQVARRMDDLETAIRLFDKVLSIRRRALGPEHPELALGAANLAAARREAGDLEAAKKLYKEAGEILERSVGPEHPLMAGVFEGMARVHDELGDLDRALELIRRASAIQESRLRRSRGFPSSGHRWERLSLKPVFVEQVRLATRGATDDAGSKDRLAEAFRAAQLGRATSSARALAQMSTRLARDGEGPAAALIRRRQDTLRAWEEADRRLIAALSGAAGERDEKRIAGLRAERATLAEGLAALERELAASHPRFEALEEGEPLTLAAARSLLRPDEALLAYLVGEEATHLAVVRPDGAKFFEVALGAAELDAEVVRLRASLDPTGIRRIADIPRFEIGTAVALHERLIAPARPLLDGVGTLLVVPDGALQSLPFGVLVAAPFAGDLGDFSSYRKVEWLAREFAVGVLPSVGSLAALRESAPAARGDLAFAGFGDPLLEGHPQGPEAARGAGGIDGGALAGPVADVEAVRRLEPLPDSYDELTEIATTLGAAAEHVFVREAATETRLKGMDLTPYRALAFATHGLVAGEFQGLAEPALVLTPPQSGSTLDDGLLTAGEIAGLTLDADWVVLSACNTAAPDGTPGAEGLSGLARAFFYAGSRTLLVSHWPVASAAAVRLTTGMFRTLAEDPSLGRAEALRRSRLALIDEGNPLFAHPIFWAPFVVVGEAGAI